jgi:hypothetical protein
MVVAGPTINPTPRKSQLVLRGPKAPLQIQPHDTAEWVVSADFVSDVTASDRIRGRVYFVNPPKLLSWNSTAKDAVVSSDWWELPSPEDRNLGQADADKNSE